MKQLISVALLLLAALFVVGCSGTDKQFHIGVSQCSEDAWRKQMNGEILRETFMYGNVDVEFRAANDNNEKQIEDIKYFINKNVDLLVVSPNETDAIASIVETAYDRGIPVVIVDRKLNSSKYNAFIGADNFQIGKSVGNYISSLSAGNLKVVELKGLTNSSPAEERHEGFVSAFAHHPNLEVVASVDAEWLRDVAFEKMDSLLIAGTDIDVCFAHNDMMAYGAYEAARKHHCEKEIKFIGVDAIAGKGLGIEAVQNGFFTASFSYPTGGDKVLQTAMNILEHRPYPKVTVLSTMAVDSLNVENLLLQSAQISELDQKIETLSGKISNYVSRYYTQKMVLFCILLILVLCAVLLVVSVKSLRSKSLMNAKLEEQSEKLKSQYEQMVQLSKRLEEATQAKLVFFTNISHDFRTPLTLIADPVDQLLASSTVADADRKLLQIVKKNTGLLLRLVNQILDFRKVENGKMEMKREALDLRECFRDWAEPFMPVAIKKHQRYSYNVDPDADFVTSADRTKLESIFFNLLSNAFKYTPENGKVTVVLERIPTGGGATIRLTVANTGSLISSEHIDKIFNRFYTSDMNHSGSGIGLALVKAFVDMHEGNVHVESDEEGTRFIVELPLIEPVEDPAADTSMSAAMRQSAVFDVPDQTEDMALDSEKATVLIIDDNADIRNYVRTILHDEYTVIEAPDGESGIKKAMKYVPDVIVCDVMMPGMDGYECCAKLKSELQTCHIPVILLTACSLDEQRIKGYAGGADSYISKPFSKALLCSRIANLIAQRKRLQEYFGDSNMLVKEDICSMDKDFVSRFKACVEREISNSDLNVEDIGRELGMSRVQLYRKMKSLTNYSPNELIRITRLKKAHSMLSALDKTVAEVAYDVGFSSPSYFAKCYKDYFGESPTANRS